MASVAGLMRLAGWNVLDQVLSALTNSVLAIVVARSVGRDDFGAFAACFLVFSVCIGVERALVGQPLGIRYSHLAAAADARWRDGVGRALGTALVVAVAGAVGCVGAGLLIGATTGATIGATLVATGVVLPALLLQDACRLVFFAQSKPHLAAANDALWAVVQFSGIGVLIVLGWATVPRLVLAWGGSAAVCVLVALSRLPAVPRPSRARSWLREHRDLWGYLLAEYLLGAGAFQGGILLVGALVGGGRGLAVIGAFRAAQVTLGPLNVLATAMRTFALPELSKRVGVGAAVLWRVGLWVGAVMAAVSVAYAAGLLLLPLAAGRALFHQSWDGAREVLLPLALGMTAGGLCLGAAIVFYSLGLASRTFRIMAVEAPLVVTLMVAGSYLGGAVGAAWGLCVDQVVLVPLWWWTLRSVLGQGDEALSRCAAGGPIGAGRAAGGVGS